MLVACSGFFVLGGALGVGGCGGGGFCSCFGADADELAVFGAAAWGEVCDGAGVVEFGEGAAVVFSGGFAVVEVADELFAASDEVGEFAVAGVVGGFDVVDEFGDGGFGGVKFLVHGG